MVGRIGRVMIRVAISGAAGRMGKTLMSAVAESDNFTLGAAVERPGLSMLGSDAGEVAGIGNLGIKLVSELASTLDDFDLLIDFTVPENTVANLATCAGAGKKMIIGTTGLSDAHNQQVGGAGRDIAIVYAPNMSIGVNVTFKLLRVAAELFGDDVDIEVIEAHHRHKVDAPSGTALRMGQVVAETLGRDLNDVGVFGRGGIGGERDSKSIGFESIRAGDIVGEHTVMFAGVGERVEITHRAHSRANFANGALRAAAWLQDKPNGVYDMQDVLGLKD